MNKILNMSRLSMMCLMLLSICIFTACDNDDDSGKSNKIVLNSFGPSPALRGGELRFIGANLDKVKAVIIPGTAAITTITVVDEREIKVTIPQDATEGYVVLETPQGEIQTETILRYEEPIVVTSISADLKKAGDVLTIEGDYLNLIKEVIFFDNVAVTDFTATRKKIEVVIPVAAQTGKIRVSNGAEIPIEVYSEKDAKIVAATVTAIAPETVKPGETVTITGTDLDLIGSLIFAGAVIAEFEEPNVNEDNTELTVVVPFEAQDGAVTVIAKSGIEYPLETALTMVVPSNLKATPDSGLKPGDIITITGEDLDLVTDINFPNIADAVKPISQSATEIKVAVPVMLPIKPEKEGDEEIIPEDARSGDIVLNMANGKTATVAYTVLQPSVTAYNPSPVMAGSELTITGTNMDLVLSVTFKGEQTVEVTTATESMLTVKVPAVGAESGVIFLNMKNGESVECAPLDIIAPSFCFIPELPSAAVPVEELLVLEVVNEDKLTQVNMRGGPTQYLLKGTTLYVLIPSAANGATDLTLISSNGEVTYTIQVLGAGVQETPVFEGFIDMFENEWSAVGIPIANFGTMSPGDRLRVYFTGLGEDPEYQLWYGDWSGKFAESKFSAAFIDVVLTAEMIQSMMNPAWGSDAMLIQGKHCIVYKIAIRAGTEPTESVVFGNEIVLAGWNNQSIPLANFGTPAPGTTIRFYLKNVGSNNAMQIFPGDWGSQLVTEHTFYDVDALKIPAGGPLYLDVDLTAEMIQRILNPAWGSDGMIIQGDDVTISKITMLKY
ncbi:IPT/TIG domain-containing protein [Bacteroides sp. 214]|uniref:IPT/TIG domain-containing protein n=1 Tax=Bacteroides sp. 214 TaxID=2302935 RepID=UPI0013D24075|nr:IPT/TIG domain-containing protein [Bacteroides sp. 214]